MLQIGTRTPASASADPERLVGVAAAGEPEPAVAPHAAEARLGDAEPAQHHLGPRRRPRRGVAAASAARRARRRPVERQGDDRDVVVAVLRAEEVDERVAPRQAGRLVDVDDVHLVDPQLVPLDHVGREVRQQADRQDDHGEGDPGQLHPLDDLLEEQVVARPDQQDVQEDEEGDPAERDQLDPGELLQRHAELGREVADAVW